MRTTPLKPKVCKECSQQFVPNKPLQTYCGHKCANIFFNRKRKKEKEVILTCLVCKKRFIKRPSDLKIYEGSFAKKKYRYCSTRCWKTRIQTLGSLKLRAWSQFTIFIRNRDKWTCFTCGKYDKGPQMHAGHFISRRHNNTLFDEMNVHAQCSACNMFRNGQPHIYAENIIKKYGLESFYALLERGKITKKYTKQELLELYDKYKLLNGV